MKLLHKWLNKNISYFWRLLFTTILSGVISLISVSLALVPGLLNAAEKNDRAQEKLLLETSRNELDSIIDSAENCLTRVEQSDWIYDLYIDHVLNKKPIYQLERGKDIVSTLSHAVVAELDNVTQVAFRFYQEPEALYTNIGVYPDIKYYTQKFPSTIYYFFTDQGPDYPHLHNESFYGQAIFSYCTEFSVTLNGAPKGELMVIFDTDAIVRRIQRSTNGLVASIQVRDVSGTPLWHAAFLDSSEEMYYTEIASETGNYIYRIALPESVRHQTRNEILPLIIIAILLTVALCSILSAWLALTIFKPVKDLSEKYVSYDGEKKNELSALETAIDQIVCQQSEDKAVLNKLRPLAQQRIIEGLLSGSVRLGNSSVDQIHYCDLLFQYSQYTVVAVSCSVFTHPDAEDKKLPLGYMEASLENLLEQVLADTPISAHLHFLDDNRYRILLNADSEAIMQDSVRRLNATYRAQLAERGIDAELHFGVGTAYKSLDNIYLSCEQAVTALNLAMGQFDDSLVFYDEYAKQINMGYYYPLSAETLLLRAIAENGADTAKSILNDIIETNRTRLFLSYNSHRLLYFNLCATIIRSAQSLGISVNVMPEASYMNQAVSLSMIHTKVSHLIDEVCDNISRVRNERSVSIEDQIVDYINQNLYNSNMSLSQVADKFKKSSAYISTVFKNVTGANYSDYVNQTRIIRATELLSQGNMSIEDVCRSVGYVSLSTFRRNFNKYTKTNPGEYITEKRDGNIKDEELE